MPSLSKCLRKLGIPQHEAAILKGIVAENEADGLRKREAAIDAVEELIDDAIADRSRIADQIRAKTGVDVGDNHPFADRNDNFGANRPQSNNPGKKESRRSELFDEIISMGGIKSTEAKDLFGEGAFRASSMYPGLIRKDGIPLDDLVRALSDRRWLPDGLYEDAETNGGTTVLAQMLDDEMRGKRAVRLGDEDSFMRSEADRRGLSQEDRIFESVAREELAREGIRNPSEEDIIDARAVAEAQRINPEAVEALPDSLDPADFMSEIRRIIDEQGANVEARGEADQRQDGDFGLEGYSREDLEDRDAAARQADADRAAAEQRAAADAGRDDFGLTGSDRPADEAEARGQRRLDGPATLYGGFPLTPVAKALVDAFKWTGRELKAIAASIKEFTGELRSAMDGSRTGRTTSPVRRFLRMYFDTDAGQIRSLLKRFNSQSANWLVEQFHHNAGSDAATGQTFSDAVAEQNTRWLSRLSEAMSGVMDDKAAMGQIANLVRNPSQIRRGTKMGDAALALQSILRDARQYLVDAGVDVGNVRDGYYPREFDTTAVMRNPTGFRDAVAFQYEKQGLDARAAREAAETLVDHVMHGGFDTIFKPEKGNTRAPFLEGRVFTKEVDSPSHPLNKFLVSDPVLSLSTYLGRAVRRAELARRVGDNFSKWQEVSAAMVKDGAAEAIEPLKNFVARAAGMRRQNPQLQMASSWARTYGALMFLEKAVLASLQEFVMPAVRTGNWLDSARTLNTTVHSLARKTKTGKEARAFAEDLGLIADGISNEVQVARWAGGDPLGQLQAKVADAFFKRTGLHAWTESSIVGSARTGQVFIRRLAKDVLDGSKLAKRSLAELGIPIKEQEAFARGLLSVNDGLPQAGEVKGEWSRSYRTAIRRFVSETIMQPNSTTKPAWHSHPIGAVVAQLQSFNYAFYENVLKRIGRMTREAAIGSDYTHIERMKLLMPMLTLPLLYGVGMVIGEGRDELLGDPVRRKEETVGDKLMKAQSRSIPFAPTDTMQQLFNPTRYQRSSVDLLSGPVFGTAGRGLDAARNIYGPNNSDNTNTAERGAAKAFYDLVIEPSANFAMFAAQRAGPLGFAASAAATQAIGAGATREAFVSKVAGDPPPRRSKKGGAKKKAEPARI